MPQSLPAREVWIEICLTRLARFVAVVSHFPQGKCGLKYKSFGPLARWSKVTSRKGSVD